MYTSAEVRISACHACMYVVHHIKQPERGLVVMTSEPGMLQDRGRAVGKKMSVQHTHTQRLTHRVGHTVFKHARAK